MRRAVGTFMMIIGAAVFSAGCRRNHTSAGAGAGDAGCTKGVTENKGEGAAWSDAEDGWWRWETWKAPDVQIPVGTRYEFDEVDTRPGHDPSRPSHRTYAWTVRSVSKTNVGNISLEVQLVDDDGYSMRATVPPTIPMPHGTILARSEKMVSVSVPAGDFCAGRVWDEGHSNNLTYDTDVWYVPTIPVAVQSWSRPVEQAKFGKELYSPPLTGDAPQGTDLSRLVRMVKPQ